MHAPLDRSEPLPLAERVRGLLRLTELAPEVDQPHSRCGRLGEKSTGRPGGSDAAEQSARVASMDRGLPKGDLNGEGLLGAIMLVWNI